LDIFPVVSTALDLMPVREVSPFFFVVSAVVLASTALFSCFFFVVSAAAFLTESGCVK